MRAFTPLHLRGLSLQRDVTGFTLLELVIVIIIIGLLATLALGNYTKMVEKSRIAEAKIVLGAIRNMQEAYRFANNKYSAELDDLYIEVPQACIPNYYFSYAIIEASAKDFVAQATRCTQGGKAPDNTTPYNITINASGAWGGDKGYY